MSMIAEAATPPVVVLVEPQLGENIGMAARAMANFGLRELRLVAPRDGWPNPDAFAPAAGAAAILEEARLYATAAEAVADLRFVLATTARARGQMKRVLGPEEGTAELVRHVRQGLAVGVLFGRERTGLENDDVSLADAILTFPAEPGFASLNLAQSVLLLGYDWARGRGAPVPPEGSPTPPPATRGAVAALFSTMETELEAAGFYPPDKKPAMARNMRDMFHRMALTEQDVRTWLGAIRALAHGRLRRKG